MAVNPLSDWRHRARCRGMNTQLFYDADTRAATRDRLRAVCGACPVRLECYEENLAIPHGMWAGLTWRERRKILERRGVPVNRGAANPFGIVVKEGRVIMR